MWLIGKVQRKSSSVGQQPLLDVEQWFSGRRCADSGSQEERPSPVRDYPSEPIIYPQLCWHPSDQVTYGSQYANPCLSLLHYNSYVHSPTIVTTDPDTEALFTEDEWKEVCNLHWTNLDEIDSSIKDYLQSFNYSNA